MLQGKTKPLQCIQDCSATKSRCNQTKQELSIEIELKYASDEVEEGEKYKNNKGRNLVRECDVNSKTIRCLLESEQEDACTVNCIGINVLIVNSVPCDRSTKETI